MKNTHKLFGTALLTLSLSACDSGTDNVAENIAIDTAIIYGPYATGSVSEPKFVYFDLETMAPLEMSDTEAKTNTTWDIAFKRSGVYLNHANSEMPVSAYFTNNNADFINSEGNAVTELFINATPESELEDFTLVTAADIPTDTALFVADETNNIINGFYDYNTTTHVVSAAPANYFIVNSDDDFSKFSVTDITTSGFSLTHITVSYTNQTASAVEFDTSTSDVVVDVAAACAAYEGVYIDFALGQTVSATDAWDISLTCNADMTGADFSIDIADDATAMQDFANSYAAIDPAAINYYDFQTNEYSVKAFDETPWYRYGVNGGHTLWSQYGVYLIQTPTATYKFQITSYYDADGTSGNLSFRAEAL
ncbi:MAG: HmuY family protein [Thalassotalea sp.]